MTIRVGISGWTYEPWRGVFFPAGLAHRRELEYASRRMSSIEINGTFYSLQRPESYARWSAETPDDFVFSVKGPRYITHIRRLLEPRTPLANFFASGPLALGRKLGPILWQLPPSFRFEPRRLDAFLRLLPRSTEAAARLAREHDPWLDGRAWTRAAGDMPLRHALEVRHESFRNPEFFEILRRREVALVTADAAGKWPFFVEQTAGFAYARLHGDEALYSSGYTPAALRAWAARLRSWARGGRDAFAYFDNDVKGRAPFDAMSLARLLGLDPEPPPRRKTFAGPSFRRHGSRGSLFPGGKEAIMEREKLSELLYQTLEAEKAGVEVYEAALSCVVNEQLREEWTKYRDQTKRHVEIVAGLLDTFQLDPEAESPGAEVVAMKGEALVKAMEKALEGGERAAAQLVAAECVIDAEAKDHLNWELLSEAVKELEGEQAEALRKAVDQVEEEEDEHLYHTMGWARELWIEFLGMPAVLPPPEEKKHALSAISAARAKASRGRMTGRRRPAGGKRTARA